MSRSPWNANIHYHSRLLDAIPVGAQRILDVGCGDGILTAQVARLGVPHVIGIDADAGVLDRARRRHRGLTIDWQLGDALEAPFERGSFDAVVSVATLHHLDAAKGLARFAELVRPGGLVGVIGLAASDWWEWPRAACGEIARIATGIARGHWEHSAPICWPPPLTYGEVARLAATIMPGVQYRRHLLGRYSLIWTKPS